MSLDDKTNIVPMDPNRKAKKKGGGNSGKGNETGARYVIDKGRMCKAGDPPTALCNFQAKIVEEVLYDGGSGDNEAVFAIEGTLADGRSLPRAEVPASGFAGLGWINAKWGSQPSVFAGNGTKDHCRAAIQELSKGTTRRTVYTHTGWRRFGEEWRYLTGSGAIGKDGLHKDVEVDPGRGHMSLYTLPQPPEGDELRAAIRASLELLTIAPERPEVGALLLASTYRASTGECSPVDHGAWLFGSTGNFKSEVAALALAHFGDFTARHLPANWSDTPADREIKAHAAKDALLIVDDFKPTGGQVEVNRQHAAADALFRAAGNQAGRGRRSANLQQRAAFHPRCLILATGEDLPRGQSLRARLTILDVQKGDVDRARLTSLQASARAGLLRQAMAGYLRWLAPQMDSLKVSLPELLRRLRDEALADGFATGHSRTSSDFASLMAGLLLLVEFATDAGALTAPEALAFQERAGPALRALMAAQGEQQREEDEVLRFFNLLRSALDSGRCHVSDRLSQGAPKVNPHGWGWRSIPPGDGDEAARIEPNGSRIGWTDGKSLWLDGEAAYAVVTTFARSQSADLGVTKGTLFKRIHERGLLSETTKVGKTRLAVKARMAGVPTWVYVMSAYVFESEALST